MARPLFSLHVTTEFGALPFPVFGEGGSRGCFSAFASAPCPLRLDFDFARDSSQLVAEDGPSPFLRCDNEDSVDWVRVESADSLRE